MSCDRNSSVAASAASRSGIPKILSKAAYLSGLRGGMQKIQERLKRFRRAAGEGRQNVPVDYDNLSSLDRQTAQPVTPKKGDTCQKCSAGSDKPGPWYVIEKQPHCSDCATGAAKEAGVKLARPVSAAPGTKSHTIGPAPEKRPASGPDARPTVSTTDGAPIVAARPVEVSTGTSLKQFVLAEGRPYMVRLDKVKVFQLQDGQEVGLAITPDFEMTAEGPRVKADAWRITHIVSGQDVAPLTFKSEKEAYGLGVLLSQFNWQQPEQMTKREIATIKATIEAYAKAARGRGEELEEDAPPEQDGLRKKEE